MAASVVEALANAARRCASLRHIALGEVEAAAGGGGGALARLQQAVLANHEAVASTSHQGGNEGADEVEVEAGGGGGGEGEGEGGSGAGGEEPAEGDAGKELRYHPKTGDWRVHQAGGGESTTVLSVISLVNLGLGDALARSLARALPRLTALRLLDISHNLLSGHGLEALGEVTNHPNPDH